MFCMELCSNSEKKTVMVSKSCQASSDDIDSNHRLSIIHKELVDKMIIHRNHRVYL